MAASSTYLTIVNNTLDESGADLASFATDGSDFTTNTNSVMQKMRKYVSRAWKDIQMTAYDWDFMEEQGLVNLDPGIMVYTDGTPFGLISSQLTNTSQNVYDQDGSVALSNLGVGTFTDLTGSSTLTFPFGYFNITGTNLSTPLNVALKPGAEYLKNTSGYTTVTCTGLTVKTTPLAYENSYRFSYHSGGLQTKTAYGVSYNSATGVVTLYIPGNLSSIAGGTMALASDVISGNTSGSTYFDGSGGTGAISSAVFTSTANQLFVHSWKSFNLNEEIQTGDFNEPIIQEFDQTSFRLIDYYNSAPSGEIPLTYVPWEEFRTRYDLSSAYPGLPRVFTKDDTGRLRFYPAPYYRFTIKFDYVRLPQILSAFTDVPKGIEEEFVDTIMWKALTYYGEYENQPSVAARAEKNYKNYMSRLELRNRQKFHFKPKRLY